MKLMTPSELILRLALPLGYAGTLFWWADDGGKWAWTIMLLITIAIVADFYFLQRKLFPPKMRKWTVTMRHTSQPLTHVVDIDARTASEALDWALVKHKDSHERFNWTGTAKPWLSAEDYADQEHAQYLVDQVRERAKADKISLWKSARVSVSVVAREHADKGKPMGWHVQLWGTLLLWISTFLYDKPKEEGHDTLD